MTQVTQVTFDLEYMPLQALVNLANAASAEINAYIDANFENHFEIEKFETIMRAIEALVASGEDIGGKPIPADWDITAHVIAPKL